MAYARRGRLLAKNGTLSSITGAAFEKFLKDYDRQKTSAFRYFYSKNQADIWLSFFETISPFTLFNWQKFYISQLFGWQAPHSRAGTICRRYTESYLEVAKKNGKTSLGALMSIAYAFLGMDGAVATERNGQNCIVANSQEQSNICLKSCEAIITGSEELLRCFKMQKNSAKMLKNPFFPQLTHIRALPGKVSSQEGPPSVFCFGRRIPSHG